MDLGEPSNRDFEDARSLQRDLRDLFSTPQRGSSDAERLEDVRRICLLARLTLNDQACHKCLRQLERYAECFFLVEDDPSWEWHTAEKYEKLRSMLLRLVHALELRVDCLEIRRRSLELSGLFQDTKKSLPLPHNRARQRQPAASRTRAPR